MLVYNTNSIAAHLLIGDGLLSSLGDFAVLLRFADGRGKPPFIAAAQLGIRG